jgi:YHS domain-containing protein
MSPKFASILILPAVLSAVLSGCGGGTSPAPQAAHDSAAKKSANAADDLPGLKELSEADRKLALQQKTCPVSGDPLGSMGTPFKMAVKGRDFFLCCDKCKAEVDKDPDGTLKKVDALMAQK